MSSYHVKTQLKGSSYGLDTVLTSHQSCCHLDLGPTELQNSGEYISSA